MPATEVLPSSAMISLENWIMSATIVEVSDEVALYESAKLLNPLRSERWRDDNFASDAWVIFDLGEAKPLTSAVFGLLDYNGDSGEDVEFVFADNSALSTNPITYTYTTYAQSELARTLRWYAGNHDGGSPGTTKRYVKVTLPANGTPDAFHQLGNIWLGPWAGYRAPEMGMGSEDMSGRSFSRGGALRADILRAQRGFDFSFYALGDWVAFHALKESLELQGPRPLLIDLHASTTDTDLKKFGCQYGYIDGEIAADLKSAEESELSFRFVEARD